MSFEYDTNKEFKDFVKSRDLKNDEYPHADAGFSMFKFAMSLLKLDAAVIVLNIIMSCLGNVFTDMSHSLAENGVPEVNTNVKLASNADALVHKMLSHAMTALCDGAAVLMHALSTTLAVMTSIVTVVLAIVIVVYAINTVLRWRAYERDCLYCDWSALRLKHDILSRMNIHARLRELDKRTNGKSSGSSSAEISISESDEREALTCVKCMKVHVNTRQSLSGDQVERRYRIALSQPMIQSTAEKLQAVVKDLDQIATIAEKGKVSFGTILVSEDRSVMTLQDSIIVADKYDYAVDESEVVHEKSESTFPLSLFVDRQQAIDKIKVDAQTWTERTAQALTMILATKKEPAKLISFSAGNSSALFTFELAMQLDLKNIASQGEMLDNAFRLKGSHMSVSEGNLLITMPLPHDLIAPINIPTMYRERFGQESEAIVK